MNRFRRTKKEKAKEDVMVTETSAPTSSFGSMLKKGKKEPEKEPQLDFASALPPTDDFRTSLLMPKLSARFSMLREQDDPESLIGKASDDSVLFPRRASRLNLFGHNPSLLSDIDEASDPGRPSLSVGRGSYASGSDGYVGDDDSHQGSIMNRGRRTEGNNLFGGRQKVYKIAPSGPSGGGRLVYEHDVNNSLFRREKAKEGDEREDLSVSSLHESTDALSRVSSNKRTTYSSTASGPTPNTRISTAATSIDEQPLATSPGQTFSPSPTDYVAPKSAGPRIAAERGSVRTRRLYGQALEQSVHIQQASTLHRLESLSRQRAGTPEMPPLNRAYSRSATNLRDRLQKLAIAEPSPAASRPTSPPSSATSPTRPPNESELKPPIVGQPPLSPPVSENEEGTTLMAALQPGDRGKATAMGLFNKPRTAYDESQFSRRQLQMFHGRNTPPFRQQSHLERPLPQEPSTRPRGVSNASRRSRAGSAASSHYSEANRPGSRSTGASVNASPARPGHVGTFFDNSSPSETEDEGYSHRDHDYNFHSDHPAFRSRTPSKPSTPTGEDSSPPLPEVRYSDLGDLKPIAEHSEQAAEKPSNLPEKPDSPTIPSGLGLSGLVRTHLRHDSDRSSIMPPPSPRFPQSTEPDTAPEPSSNQQPDDIASRPPTMKPPPIPTWQEDLIRHERNGSTETQKEREEFANELAERRRRVQEKLRDFAESESRAASPVSGRQTPDFGGQPRPGNAFALLKNKPGKHNIFNRGEPRGMKGLGFGGNASTPTLVSDDPWGEDLPLPNIGRHGNSSSPHIGERSMRSRIASFGRRSQEDSRDSSRSRGASPHSSFRSRRDRSSSDASGRSKSRSRRERDDLGTLEEDETGSDNSFTSRSGRRGVASTTSSGRPSVEAHEPPTYDRSPSAASGRYRPESRSATPSIHDRPFHAPMANSPLIGVSPRPSPAAPPFSANATPPLNDVSGSASAPAPPAALANHPQGLPQRTPGSNNLPKRTVDKSQISEPTFISCTSNVPTVGLPPGASLGNGMETPPLPPMNPRRRRQTTTQTILGAFKGDNRHDALQPVPVPHADREPGPELSTFSDDGEKRVPRPRNRLRKISSEGGELNAAKVRQTMSAGVSPAPPTYPPRIPMDGGMF
ncbi:hypothetical protein BJY01DRAFT_169997 [Aspergillus pseudoustus]|uniref:DUF4045 domain-containing protein n=1 Tax=Aspergillus pseudoustus TaxID=1810923 RepID=A0ABR4KWB6_9EURO